jgi:hypothetical protein
MNLARIALLAAVCLADGILLLGPLRPWQVKSSPTWRRLHRVAKTWDILVAALSGRTGSARSEGNQRYATH